MAGITQAGTSGALIAFLGGVFLFGVIGLACAALAGVLSLDDEGGVAEGSSNLVARALFLVRVGNTPSRYLYRVWYTFGGHGGRGRIVGRARVCLSLWMVLI